MERTQANRDETSPTDFRTDLKVSLCSWAKEYLSTYTGYPYVSEEYVATYIERPETSRSELDEYRTTHSPMKYRIRLAMMLSSICFFLRVMALPTIALRELNLNNFSANLKWRSDGLVQFSCIVSNCSDSAVDSEILSDKLVELPYFSICHPQLSSWHDVTQYLGINGIMLAATSGLAVAVAGLVLPLLNKLRPTGNLILMFLVAPRVTRRVVEDRALELLCELVHSKRNYSTALAHRHHNRSRRRSETVPHCRPQTNSLVCRPHEQNILKRSDYCAIRHNNENSHIISDNCLLPRRLRDLRLDTLPYSLGTKIQTHPDYQLLSRVNERPQVSTQNLCQIVEPSKSPSDESLLYDKSSDRLHDHHMDLASSTTNFDSDPSLNQKEFAKDCVTILRSSWWHTQATSAMWNLVLITMGDMVVQIFLSGFALVYFVNERREVYQSIADDLRHWSCSLWIDQNNALDTENSPGELRPLEVDSLEINLNLGLSVIYVAQCVWPFICVNFFLLFYFMANAELICWLHEIKLGLRMSVQLVRQILENQKESDEQSDSIKNTQICVHEVKPSSGDLTKFQRLDTVDPKVSFASEGKKFDMDIVRTKVSQLIHLKFLWIVERQSRNRLSKFEADRDTERFISSAIRQHRMKLDAAAELLEKLYINFRIFAEHMDHYGNMMSVMLTFTNIYIYAFIIVAVLFLRSIKDHILFPVLLLSIGWITANGLILLPSNVHAKAKGLHGLIWTLAAIMNESSDDRLGHMRSLWIKQVIALDRDGGLALKAFSVRITYILIVQLIIGTGTVVVFALRL